MDKDYGIELHDFVFVLEEVICTPPNYDLDNPYSISKPYAKIIEFINWLSEQGHNITLWSKTPNLPRDPVVMYVYQWLAENNVTWDNIIFNCPKEPILIEDMNDYCIQEQVSLWIASIKK